MVRRRSGLTKLGCLFYLLIVAALVYFGVKIGETYFRYLEYKDAMAQELRFRAQLPDKDIKAHMKLVADSLGLPQDAGVVTITRKEGRITMEAHYEELVDLPFIKREIHYEPRAVGTYY